MLEGLEPPVNKAVCKVERLAAELSQEDKEILESALADSRWTTNALVSALADRGFVVGDTALRKHRDGKCCCAR